MPLKFGVSGGKKLGRSSNPFGQPPRTPKAMPPGIAKKPGFMPPGIAKTRAMGAAPVTPPPTTPPIPKVRMGRGKPPWAGGP